MLSSHSKTVSKIFTKREVARVLFLPNTVCVQKARGRDQKFLEVIMADKSKHPLLENYLKDFWTNYV